MTKWFLSTEDQTQLSVNLTFDLSLELIESYARIQKGNIQGRGKIRDKNFNQRNKISTEKWKARWW